MIDGTVEIIPKPDGLIDPLQLLKATYDSGVSVAEMNVVARGRVIKNSSGGMDFMVEPTRSFTIVQNELSSQLQTKADSQSVVTIKGLLFQKQRKQKKQMPSALTLTVLEIQKEE